MSISSFGQASTNYKRYHGDGIDDVLQYTPMAASFLLKAAGVKCRSSWEQRHRQQVVPLRTYGNSLQRSHRAAQGVRQDQSVDQRGGICRGHDNRRGPRQTKPSPLGGCCYRSRHRFPLRTGKLLDSGQNHRKVQKEGCRWQHHRRGTEDTNRCCSRRTCNGNKAITAAIKPV